MIGLVERLQKEGPTRSEARRIGRKPSPSVAGPRTRLPLPTAGEELQPGIAVPEGVRPEDEIIRTLESILEDLRRS